MGSKCEKCNDTGVIETGNNDLPCDCKHGDSAVFNHGTLGTFTGAFVKKHLLNDSPEPLDKP